MLLFADLDLLLYSWYVILKVKFCSPSNTGTEAAGEAPRALVTF